MLFPCTVLLAGDSIMPFDTCMHDRERQQVALALQSACLYVTQRPSTTTLLPSSHLHLITMPRSSRLD